MLYEVEEQDDEIIEFHFGNFFCVIISLNESLSY
jgi:hypothetical protein